MANHTEGEDTLRDLLDELKTLGAVALKGGFEAEAQTLEDVLRMRMLDPRLPITVKIGGPEAYSDLRLLFEWGIRSFVAPMVETPFAVRKVVQAMRTLCGDDVQLLEASINLESVTAYRLRHDILSCPDVPAIAKVNVGRTDLAASVDRSVYSGVVMHMTRSLIAVARARGLRTGLGGSIVPDMIEAVLAGCAPDEFETRHVIFETARTGDAPAAVRLALEFEATLIDWLNAPRQRLVDEGRRRQSALTTRMTAFQSRVRVSAAG